MPIALSVYVTHIHYAVYVSTLLTDLTLQRHQRVTKKKKSQLTYCKNATKFSLLQKTYSLLTSFT